MLGSAAITLVTFVLLLHKNKQTNKQQQQQLQQTKQSLIQGKRAVIFLTDGF